MHIKYWGGEPSSARPDTDEGDFQMSTSTLADRQRARGGDKDEPDPGLPNGDASVQEIPYVVTDMRVLQWHRWRGTLREVQLTSPTPRPNAAIYPDNEEVRSSFFLI